MLNILSTSRRSGLCILACALLVASGCATKPAEKNAGVEIESLPDTTIENSLDFRQETLYSLMAAEIGLVRGRYELGLNNYVQQARDTQDVNIAARAAQVSRILKRHPESLEMAELWRKLDPGAHEARYILVSEYITAKKFDRAFEEADSLLRAGYAAGFDEIAIKAVQNESEKTALLYKRYAKMLEEYPENTELLIGASVLVYYQDRYEEALSYAQRADAIASDDTRIIYQHFRCLSALDRDEEATQVYGRLVELQPDNHSIRTSYAQMLARYDLQAALTQYQILKAKTPEDSDSLLNLALIQLELDLIDQAQENFQTLLQRQAHLSISHYGLGEIAYMEEDVASALGHYTQVNDGRRFVQAASKAASIIVTLNGIDEARQYLTERRSIATENDQESLYLIEANALATDSSLAAVELLNEGIRQFPNSIKLRYSRAMNYTILREPLQAELDFKYILETQPQNAATLNALGYTLLDQTDRLDEAGSYLKRAIALEPNDPAILDSVGWYYFQKGKATKALTYLEKAFEQFVDDEVASHLGEVLWSLGKRSKAKRVWKQGFKVEPNSVHILQTLERLNIAWP